MPARQPGRRRLDLMWTPGPGLSSESLELGPGLSGSGPPPRCSPCEDGHHLAPPCEGRRVPTREEGGSWPPDRSPPPPPALGSPGVRLDYST